MIYGFAVMGIDDHEVWDEVLLPRAAEVRLRGIGVYRLVKGSAKVAQIDGRATKLESYFDCSPL